MNIDRTVAGSDDVFIDGLRKARESGSEAGIAYFTDAILLRERLRHASEDEWARWCAYLGTPCLHCEDCDRYGNFCPSCRAKDPYSRTYVELFPHPIKPGELERDLAWLAKWNEL